MMTDAKLFVHDHDVSSLCCLFECVLHRKAFVARQYSEREPSIVFITHIPKKLSVFED